MLSFGICSNLPDYLLMHSPHLNKPFRTVVPFILPQYPLSKRQFGELECDRTSKTCCVERIFFRSADIIAAVQVRGRSHEDSMLAAGSGDRFGSEWGDRLFPHRCPCSNGSKQHRARRNVRNRAIAGHSKLLGLPIEVIAGGAQRGQNLFHSFSQFNVSAGRGAYFANPVGVQNILSRVTGGNPSNILGTLGVLGSANLFLINPNGIVFGPNAALDLQGSFAATTANAIQLGETGLFSASQPETSNLLTVDPSAFFFNALQPQPIISLSRSGFAFTTQQPTQGLQVSDGRSLLLVGGGVGLGGGILRGPWGRIELGGLAAPGSIAVNSTDLSLKFPNDADRADVVLLGLPGNQSLVDVTASNDGSIVINAKNLTLQNSQLLAGIFGEKAQFAAKQETLRLMLQEP